LPGKRGPTVNKIALWLFLGRGQTADVAKRLRSKLINVYTREEYFSRLV